MIKLFEVFTKEYKAETRRIEYMKRHANIFKLGNHLGNENKEVDLSNLINKNFKSNFKLTVNI